MGHALFCRRCLGSHCLDPRFREHVRRELPVERLPELPVRHAALCSEHHPLVRAVSSLASVAVRVHCSSRVGRQRQRCELQHQRLVRRGPLASQHGELGLVLGRQAPM
eukprot:Amastigsp_a340440_177.p3 type:complete len:108 gc:universal Amastigsp_a340440_177:434-111(-)